MSAKYEAAQKAAAAVVRCVEDLNEALTEAHIASCAVELHEEAVESMGGGTPRIYMRARVMLIVGEHR